MKTLYELCTPRKSIFDATKRDDVLDLSNLVDGSLDPAAFFEENYFTDGMKVLLNIAFERFTGKGDSGIVKLTQSMGGGKTHSMIALGLLAQRPEIRKGILEKGHPGHDVGKVKVVAFTGRESDAPLGIWGAIAEQLGKKEMFSSYYSPLSAPGQSAWVNLLKGEPVLIMLDELPPYLENAKSKLIGNSDLSVVTTTALANLFVAIGKRQLENVCLVISDLKATYESGSELLQSSFKELENETNRYAQNIEPVGSTSDEVYHILKKRLFATLPDEGEANTIAKAYQKTVAEAKQMDLTTLDPDVVFLGIKESYPFHPSIRDLYARFKENPGFQQTRGLIRLMRTMVADLYKNNAERAKCSYLVHAYDLDLNNRELHSVIQQIKPSLTNAISHDIASEGKSTAETIDREGKSSLTQDISRLFLVASLGNVHNALLGLSLPEAIGYLCEPDRDSRVIRKTFDEFAAKAWYLHADRQDNFFFKDTKNLVAQIKAMVDSYDNESAKKELRQFLFDKFNPQNKDCYQEIVVFPAIDEIEKRVGKDKILLILTEPYADGGLHPDIQKFYDNTTYQNRVMFLSGQRNTMNTLLASAKEHKAIHKILEELGEEKVSEKDSQYLIAQNKQERILLNLLQSARETFSVLFYPSKNALSKADFIMEFKNNKYNGEEQVRKVLKDKYKFTDEVTGDSFKGKVEGKLFTQKEMRWVDIKDRAATDPSWLWYVPKALDCIKDDMVKKDIWRETGGGYIAKGPFAKEPTEVIVQHKLRDDESGEVTLAITAKNGNRIHYEIDGPATPSSAVLENANSFKTSELKVSFLAIDTTGEHPTGELKEWRNSITLKHRVYDKETDKWIELKAAPKATIRYTTDGSDPKNCGGTYEGDFAIPKNTQYVLAVAEKKGIYSNKVQVGIEQERKPIEIKKELPLVLLKRNKTKATADSYELMAQFKRHEAKISDVSVMIDKSTQNKGEESWIEIQFSEGMEVAIPHLEEQIAQLRDTFFQNGSITMTISYSQLHFPTGQHFLDWIASLKVTLDRFKKEEIRQ